MLETSLSFSPKFTELLAKRGLTDPEAIEKFLAADLDDLCDPLRMKGMPEAAARLQKAVRAKEKILIHGDYDVDGITGAALIARTLTILKADFSTFLPERVRDGYGVSGEAIRAAHQKGVSLLVTVDCGITAREEIQMARSLGVDVIVIDHHRLPPEGLPPATVILNPLQEDCDYPFKELSAAGLAFKLSQVLIGERARQFLDLAALSTVSDVAPLRGENRIIVKNGLKILSERANPGIRALAEVAGLRAREVNVGHIGFVIGPRINAAGRMSSADIALRLLMTENPKEAESLALALQEENKVRQKEERQVVKDALAEVERTFHFNRDRVIVVGKATWHPGVIGIVASRLVDKYYRPSLVISIQDGIGKGSGRSVKHFHLFRALEACKDLFEEFGGHEQAAGFAIREENIPELRRRINQYAAENCPPETFLKKVNIDLELKLEDLKSVFIRELELLEPHGAGNPRPVFLTRGLKHKGKPRQPNPQTLQFWLTDGTLTCEALWTERAGFPGTTPEWMGKGSPIDFVYSLKTRVWDGRESLVLEVKEIRPRS